MVSKQTGADVNIGKAYFVFFNRIILQDVSIIYDKKDTLAASHKISVVFSSKELIKSKIKINSARLEDGVFNLIHESQKMTNLDRVFKLNKKQDTFSKRTTTKEKSLNFLVKRLQIKNFRFNYRNPFSGSPNYGKNYINFTNLKVRDINIIALNINVKRDTLFARIKELQGIDESGFSLERFEGNLAVSKKESRISNLIISDGNTLLKADHFSFYYDSAKDFAEFTKKVRMELELKDSYFSFKTIGKITPSLKDNILGFHLRGYAGGPLNSLLAKDLLVTSTTGFSSLLLNARINGLPKVAMTMAFADITDCRTNTSDIFNIVAGLNGNNKKSSLGELFESSVFYNFEGNLTGLLTDFVASGKIVSNIGSIDLDLLLRSEHQKNGFEMKGILKADNFDIGKLVMNKELGKISVNSSMTALLRSPVNGGNKFVIDSLSISKLDLHNYSYSNIIAGGKLENDIFDGRVICHDQNLDMIFQGIISLNTKEISHYDFYANVTYANLSALNLDKRDSISRLNFRTLANYTRQPSGDIFGNIDVYSAQYHNSKGAFDIGDIKFSSLSTSNEFSASLTSKFADLEYEGKEFFTVFLKTVENLTIGKHLPELSQGTPANENNSNLGKYSLNIKFKDTKAATELLMPGLFIADKSYFNLIIEDANLKADMRFPMLSYGKVESTAISSNITANNLGIKGYLSANNLAINEFSLRNDSIKIDAANGIANIFVSFLNKDEYESSLNLKSALSFNRATENKKLTTTIDISESDFSVSRLPWRISKSRIVLENRDIKVDSLKLYYLDQFIRATGSVSEKEKNKLNIEVKDLELEPFNMLFGEKLALKGTISGFAEISDWFSEMAIAMNLKGRNLFFNGTKSGDFNITSKWDNSKKGFEISAENINDGIERLVAGGFYKPEGSLIDMEVKLFKFPIAGFEPFLNTLLSELKGDVSAQFRVNGQLKKPEIVCDNGKLENAGFRVKYTNVFYNLEAPFTTKTGNIRISGGKLTDRFGNKGTVNFDLIHNNFNNFRILGGLNFSNLECINTKEKDNPSFYGNMFGTGNMEVTGSFSKINMNIEVSSNANSVLHIPLSSAAEASQTNLLTFISDENLLEKGGKLSSNSIESKKSQSTALELKLRAFATPDAALKIEINKAVGDIITGYGNGNIDIDVKTAENSFNIFGDYIIDRGNYQFGYALKQFDINNGGRISFNGDIANTNLDLTASYKTKASINTLIADTTSVSNRRTVDCLISMTGALMNPTLGFNIEIPDLDPATDARVKAALNSEDKVLRQVMSVLISGSFVPDMQSNIVNNTNIIYSNLSEIFSNQINSIFNQLDIPVDLNFNYQQGNSGQNIFDAAVSAQLMDNRIIFNGNIGNSPYASRSGNITGDLEFEIKLDPKGKIRAKIFSRSADQYSNYLEGIQRSGFGIVYQEEFDSFGELLDKIFVRNKKIKFLPSQSGQ